VYLGVYPRGPRTTKPRCRAGFAQYRHGDSKLVSA
jgi:hypothetical protein